MHVLSCLEEVGVEDMIGVEEAADVSLMDVVELEVGVYGWEAEPILV